MSLQKHKGYSEACDAQREAEMCGWSRCVKQEKSKR